MMKNSDKMGELVLMAHLIVTVLMLLVYVTFAYMGKPLTTIENMLLVIVGYWFGAMGTQAIRPNNQTQIQQATGVKIQSQGEEEQQ